MSLRSCSIGVPEILNPISDDYSSIETLQRELIVNGDVTTPERKVKALGIALLAGVAGFVGAGILSAPLFRITTETLVPYLDGSNGADPNSKWQLHLNSIERLHNALKDRRFAAGQRVVRDILEDSVKKQEWSQAIIQQSFDDICLKICVDRPVGDSVSLKSIFLDCYQRCYDVGIRPEFRILQELQYYAFCDLEK